MTQWTPIQGLKEYGRVLARKVGFSAIGWVIVYFLSYPFRAEGNFNPLMLFAPLIGAAAGLVVGWYMATDSVEDSGMNGLPLWAILVAGSWLPMLAVEGLMHLLLPNWPFGFGAWMVLMSAMILALAAAVWHSSTQE